VTVRFSGGKGIFFLPENPNVHRKEACMRIMSRIVVCAVLVVMVAGVAVAQFAKPEDAVKYRKAVMSVIAQHFKEMAAVVQGKSEFAREYFSADAETVEHLATRPWEAFLEPGTDKGDTTMRSAVFEEKDDFMKAAQAFQENTALLASAARGADLDGIKAPFNAVAQDCKSCHKAFRK
jgi:cytochrome c556